MEKGSKGQMDKESFRDEVCIESFLMQIVGSRRFVYQEVLFSLLCWRGREVIEVGVLSFQLYVRSQNDSKCLVCVFFY